MPARWNDVRNGDQSSMDLIQSKKPFADHKLADSAGNLCKYLGSFASTVD